MRLFFNIVSELIHNAMSNSDSACTYIRIGKIDINDNPMILVSNLSSRSLPSYYKMYEGARYQSELEHIMETGGSGLKRIAGAYATVVGKDESIHVISKKNSFHVLIPLINLLKLNSGG